jgi:transcriptional regulator with XRE-family HTH domain
MGKKIGVSKFLGDRFREWRKDSSLTLKDLEKIIGITPGPLSELENNKSLPSIDTLAKIYRYTDINIFWLILNEGPMRRTTKYQESHNEEGALPSILHSELDGNANFSEMMEIMKRIYENGDPEKIAKLKGFLMGADPR